MTQSDRVTQAVEHARWLIKHGKAPGLAITLADQKFNVSTSEVARRLAQRRRRR